MSTESDVIPSDDDTEESISFMGNGHFGETPSFEASKSSIENASTWLFIGETVILCEQKKRNNKEMENESKVLEVEDCSKGFRSFYNALNAEKFHSSASCPNVSDSTMLLGNSFSGDRKAIPLDACIRAEGSKRNAFKSRQLNSVLPSVPDSSSRVLSPYEKNMIQSSNEMNMNGCIPPLVEEQKLGVSSGSECDSLVLLQRNRSESILNDLERSDNVGNVNESTKLRAKNVAYDNSQKAGLLIRSPNELRLKGKNHSKRYNRGEPNASDKNNQNASSINTSFEEVLLCNDPEFANSGVEGRKAVCLPVHDDFHEHKQEMYNSSILQSISTQSSHKARKGSSTSYETELEATSTVAMGMARLEGSPSRDLLDISPDELKSKNNRDVVEVEKPHIRENKGYYQGDKLGFKCKQFSAERASDDIEESCHAIYEVDPNISNPPQKMNVRSPKHGKKAKHLPLTRKKNLDQKRNLLKKKSKSVRQGKRNRLDSLIASGRHAFSREDESEDAEDAPLDFDVNDTISLSTNLKEDKQLQCTESISLDKEVSPKKSSDGHQHDSTSNNLECQSHQLSSSPVTPRVDTPLTSDKEIDKNTQDENLKLKRKLKKDPHFNDPMGKAGDEIEDSDTRENPRKRRSLSHNDFFQNNNPQDNATELFTQQNSVSTEIDQSDFALFPFQEGSMNEQQKPFSRNHPQLYLHARKKFRKPGIDSAMDQVTDDRSSGRFDHMTYPSSLYTPSIQTSMHYFNYDDHTHRGFPQSLPPDRVRFPQYRQIDIVEFGHPCDEVIEGLHVYSRHTLLLWGAHKSDISCVSGNKLLGCDSIIYMEEEVKTKDCLCFIQYTCSQSNGGSALFANYKMSQYNNAIHSYPIRVFRKSQDIHGNEGLRYDGLYHVTAIYDDKGRPRSELCKSSKTFSFLLQRNSVGDGGDQNQLSLEKLFELINNF
jgi:SAD/SRA domain